MPQKPLGTFKTEPQTFCFIGLKSKVTTKLLRISELYPNIFWAINLHLQDRGKLIYGEMEEAFAWGDWGSIGHYN